MNTNKILIIEDDVLIQEELQILLRSNGYETDTIHDFQHVIDEIHSFDPNLILLDINLPFENGFKICSKIRTFSNVPIIFVTSRNTDMDELNSIMLGGDAFITKPYHTAILLAKIASLLKRTYQNTKIETETFSYHDVILHLENSTLEYKQSQIELTKNELKILYYLFKHAGKICNRIDMIDFLWEEEVYIDDNTLSVNINRIRKKLETLNLYNFIQTKHRQGYII